MEIKRLKDKGKIEEKKKKQSGALKTRPKLA